MSLLYGFQPDSCLKYLRKFVELSHGNLGLNWSATVSFNTGFAFCQKKEWDSAYQSFASALEFNSRLRNKTDIWLLQQNMDSVRKWGRIPKSGAESQIPRIPQPRGVTQDFDMYLMGKLGKPVPGLPGLFERLSGDTSD
jgi:hypothetical protein